MASLNGINFALKEWSLLGMTDFHHKHFNNALKSHIIHFGNGVRKIFWQRSQEKLSAILRHLHLCPVHMLAFARENLGDYSWWLSIPRKMLRLQIGLTGWIVCHFFFYSSDEEISPFPFIPEGFRPGVVLVTSAISIIIDS